MSHNHLSPRAIRGDPAFVPLKQYVIEATGLAYYENKDDELASHLAKRMAALGVNRCDGYLTHLRAGDSGHDELDRLATNLTIGETFFFRHRELFDALRDQVFPQIIERNRQYRTIRIWSAGCSIGAEAYSLSILLRREFEQQLAGWDITILGTDINREFLTHAQSGEFGEWSFRAAPEDLKATCFARQGATWKIHEEYRRGVSFQYHNLVQHPFPSLVNNLTSFDLILCRNVMIYFNPLITQKLVGQFGDCLVDDGWFVVGHSEPNIDLFRDFRTMNAPGVVLYRRGLSTELPGQPPTWSPPVFDTAVPSNIAASDFSTISWTAPLAAEVRPASVKSPVTTTRPRRSRQTSMPAVVPASLTLQTIRGQLDRGEWGAASENCRRLEPAEKLNPLFHFYQALLAEQLGKYEETESALRRAVYLDRGFVLAHYHLGLVLHRNRDSAAAGRCFRNVLSLLEKRNADEVFPEADGLTVGDLQRLSQMHQEVLHTP